MAVSKGPMMEFDNAEALKQILATCFKLNEMQQINLLVGQMKEMEKNYFSVLQELTEVKAQLNTLTQGMQPTVKNSISQTAEDVERKAAEQHQNLQSMGRHLESRSKQIVQKFRDIGISALNNVAQFLGIKEKLIVMRDNARSNEMAMKNSIEKLEKIQAELSAAKFHAKNVINSITGKETALVPPQKRSRIFEKLKSPYLKWQAKYARRVEKLNRSIEKFDSLEKEVKGIKIGRESKQFKVIYYDKNSQLQELFAETKEQAMQAVRDANPDLKRNEKCSLLKYDPRQGEYQSEGVYQIATGKDITPVMFDIPTEMSKENYKLARQELKDAGIHLKLSPNRKMCYVERSVGDEAVNKVKECLEKYSKLPVQEKDEQNRSQPDQKPKENTAKSMQKPSVRDKLAQNKESVANNNQNNPPRQKERSERQHDVAR